MIVGALCKETAISSSAFTVPNHTHVIVQEITDYSEPDAQPDAEPSLPAVSPYNYVAEPSKSVPTRVVLWRGLRVDDKVFMLKVGKGQKYYILQRVEGVV